MSEVVDISKIMKFSVLGFNFADWIKDFKEAFRQSDGTYDYMAYFSQLNNPVAFYLLIGRLGSEKANDFLNSAITPTIDRIEVVGGRKQKGGCGPMCKMFTFIFILLLFMSSIDSAFAGVNKDNLDDFKKNNPNVNINQIEKPDGKKGWLWNSSPTQKQMDEYNKAIDKQKTLNNLIKLAGEEQQQNQKLEGQKLDVKQRELEAKQREQELERQKIDVDKIKARSTNENTQIFANMFRSSVDSFARNSEQMKNLLQENFDIRVSMEEMKTYVYTFGVTAVCGMVALIYLIPTQKNILIPNSTVVLLRPNIDAGINTKDIIMINDTVSGVPNYYTSQQHMNLLNNILNATPHAVIGYNQYNQGQNNQVQNNQGQNNQGLGYNAPFELPRGIPAGFGDRGAAVYSNSNAVRPPGRFIGDGRGGKRTRKIRKSRKIKKTINRKRR